MREARKRRSVASVVAACVLSSSGIARAEPPGTATSPPVQDGLVEPPRAEYRPTPPPIEEAPNTLAFVSLVTAGTLLATGIGFGVASVIEHRSARELEQRANADDEELEDGARRQYDEAIERRDDFRVVSGVAGGLGLGLFVFSGVLFARDHIRRDETQAPTYVATPVLGPGAVGGSATVTF